MTEQHDLVARLRGMFVRFATETEDEAAIRRKATALEAAARIEALESDNARMREALEPFATWADHYRATTHDHYVPECEIDGPGHSLTITLGTDYGFDDEA